MDDNDAFCRLVLAVWRQAINDLHRGDDTAHAWVTSRAFDFWVACFDTDLNPDTVRAALLRLDGVSARPRRQRRRAASAR